MTKIAIRTDKAPTPTGPFNQAIRAGNFIFTSGQAGRNRETGLMGDIHDQARRCIGNIGAVLEAAGSSLADIVKVTVYLRHAGDWKGFNEEYVKLMPVPLPARTSAIVDLKAPDMLVEMEVIAVIADDKGMKPERMQMNALDVITTRTSPHELTGQIPTEEILTRALEAAVAAPDHGRMRPWRFILIEGEARQTFGTVLADALKRRNPDATPSEVEREAAKPLRAPLVVAVAAKVKSRPGIPEVEQILATGAAVQNFSLALFAQGYATTWKTGEPAYDPSVKAALGLDASDAIVGFIYVGTPVASSPARPRPASEDFVSRWIGPPA